MIAFRPYMLLIAALLCLESPALSQDEAVSAAKAGGLVGEQLNGYLGFAGEVSPEVRAAVGALNIERRAAYTDLATKLRVTVEAAASASGCQILSARVLAGQLFRIGSAPWQIKGAAPIALPHFCNPANH